MILARFIGMVVFFIPAIVIATVGRQIVSGITTPIASATGFLSDFEVAMIMIVPYMILVWCAIVRPITSFWGSIQNRNTPNIPPRQGYE